MVVVWLRRGGCWWSPGLAGSLLVVEVTAAGQWVATGGGWQQQKYLGSRAGWVGVRERRREWMLCFVFCVLNVQ